jgi:hypothetical protein
MIHPDIVRRLRNSREWAAVEAHIRDAIRSLDTVADIEGDDRAIAIEVVARKHAAGKLRAILEPFELFGERTDIGGLVKEKESDAGL